MKILSSLFIILNLNLLADKNWIDIEPLNKKTSKQTSETLDINLSQIQPLNKMLQNAKVIQQVMDTTTREKKKYKTEKNWFVINKNKI
ncbi:MAG: hypothetical protein U9O86_07275 [Campylobacterota bacterium]|nr:hypothetical protein [Campylobacterota bacterium]